jgi:hypothetical protein
MLKLNPSYFYKTANIETPNDISHRHFRLLLENGEWMKLFRIKDIEELRKYLIRFSPIKAYISVSCFLEPELVGLKWKTNQAGYKYLPNIIISTDFVCDFDDGVASLEQMLKAYKYLKTLGFERFKAVRTYRGFHLHILDFFTKECQKNMPASPIARETYLTSKKKELCTKLESNGIEFDKPISIDTRRVIKLWGSLSDDTFICKAYSDPMQLAKEFIQSNEYLQHKPEAERGLIVDTAR